MLASARLSLVPLSSDEPHANAENNEAGKYGYLDQQVDCVHMFRAVRVHNTQPLTTDSADLDIIPFWMISKRLANKSVGFIKVMFTPG